MPVSSATLAPDQMGAAISVERQLLDYLRKTQTDLNSRTSLKNARAELSRLVEIWNQEHSQRQITDRYRFSEVVLRNLIGFGPLEPLLEDEAIWEISINGPKKIYVRSHGSPPRGHTEGFHDAQHLERVLSRMLETSVGGTRQLDPSLGVQDARLPDGTRIHIVHPELTRTHDFAVSIRKFAKQRFNSIADLVVSGTLSEQAGDFLFRAVSSGASVLVSGPPGSGKTTTLNALIDSVPDDHRVVVIEETPEIMVEKPDTVQLHSRSARPGRPEISLRNLVRASLRMSCNVLVLGEVRDDESLALLLALSTGIQGMSTIHSASCNEALARLRLLVQLSLDGSVPLSAVNKVIADAIDLVIHLRRTDHGIVAEEIIAIEEGSLESSSGFVATPLFLLDPSRECLSFSGQNPLRMGNVKVADLSSKLVGNFSTVVPSSELDESFATGERQ